MSYDNVLVAVFVDVLLFDEDFSVFIRLFFENGKLVFALVCVLF